MNYFPQLGLQALPKLKIKKIKVREKFRGTEEYLSCTFRRLIAVFLRGNNHMTE